MTDEELITRLNNLFWMLEEDGHYTKANTARFAKDRIEAQAAEIERLRGDLAKAVAMLDKTRLVLAEWEPHPFPVLTQVRATLAELTGDKPWPTKN